MGECPRCGGKADQLHPLPTEVLARPGTGDRQACRWCIHEVTEG